MKTQGNYRRSIEKGRAIVQTACVNIDGIQPIAQVLRNVIILAVFLIAGLTASAKPHYGPSFGYHHHHYVYYPKQNFYYDPFVGTYIVYERGVWVRQLAPPRLLARININILPHVDVYVDSFYPEYYNYEHRHTYRLIYLVAPSTTFYVFRLPQRYDFTISPYEYYTPHRHIVYYYNPNYYYHRDKYPRGNAYGHYKHHVNRNYYAYNHRYPSGHGNGGPGFNGVGNPARMKSHHGDHPAPFGRPGHGGAYKKQDSRPFGTMPQHKNGGAKKGNNNGPQMTPQHRGGGGKPGKGGNRNVSVQEQQTPNNGNGNWQRPGGNREQNMQKEKNARPMEQNYPEQRNNIPQQRQEPQSREQRPIKQENVRQERNVQGAPRTVPNQNKVGTPRGGKKGKG
jgi:hypothetical protein